jgi:proteasome assembly chaperone (PAC2) family protein
MSEYFEILAEPALRDPLLLIGLEGWIDAGAAAGQAMAQIADETGATTIARFSSDAFIDYRARRPTMQLRDGVMDDLIWPTIELRAGRDNDGNDVLLLVGAEPDGQWQLFLGIVEGFAHKFEVRAVAGIGAYPFNVPHTRPSLVAGSASSAALVERAGLLRNSVDVPAGIGAAIEHRLAGMGIDAFGLWVQVPHYASAGAYPAASVALIDTLRQLTHLAVDATPLREAATAHRLRLDELVSQSAEHLGMVRQLEEAFDAMMKPSEAMVRPGEPLPSGEELAAELERFLRDQGR